MVQLLTQMKRVWQMIKSMKKRQIHGLTLWWYRKVLTRTLTMTQDLCKWQRDSMGSTMWTKMEITSTRAPFLTKTNSTRLFSTRTRTRWNTAMASFSGYMKTKMTFTSISLLRPVSNLDYLATHMLRYFSIKDSSRQQLSTQSRPTLPSLVALQPWHWQYLGA